MYYPNISREILRDRNLAIEAFGHRIFDSQTVYEYLIEFFLVFISGKGWGETDNGQFCFPIPKPTEESTDKLHYSPIARIGLKRFIFFERSKQEHRFIVDKNAYSDLMDALKNRIHCNVDGLNEEDIISIIQDLFYGFNAVIKNRAWFVQALLPMTPEITFAEAMGNAKVRQSLHSVSPTFKEIDGGFQFQGHYFLARGGEIYFLHLLRGLLNKPDLKERLEQGLKRLITVSFPQLSWLAKWVESNWLECMQTSEEVVINKTCEWIPEGYSRRSELACVEMVNLLEAEIPELQKLDLFAKGLILQILRMMHEQAAVLCNGADYFPGWVIQLGKKPGTNTRKYAVSSYNACEEEFVRALDKQSLMETEFSKQQPPLEEVARIKAIKEGSKHSVRLFRKLAKDIGLVVPPKGGSMRFTLNEDLVKFLVISIIRPGKKMLLSDFLKQLYNRFGFIIGPEEQKSDLNIVDFDNNRNDFQDMLKRCGFLRDLSDATSIVENPFGGMS